jgi:hypothetical protein
MIFPTVILLLALGVAFIHYVQGFFSAMISAFLVILSAAIALGYHENLSAMLFTGFAPAQAHSLALVVLFAVCYVVLRVVFDKLVPGNIQVPVIADKVGAGVCGLIAGIFSTGVLAIAAQALPLGPTIAGYARVEVQDRTASGVAVAGRRQMQDIPVYDEIKIDNLTSAEAATMLQADSPRITSMMLPVDDWTVGMVSHLSAGSLWTGRTFASVHPAYLNELFGQRLGIQVGAKHVMSGEDSIRVEKMVSSPELAPALRWMDGEAVDVRGKGRFDATKPVEGQLLVIRVRPSGGTDTDNLLRFSLGSVRMVTLVGEEGSDIRTPTVYFPIGTVVDGQTLARRLPDDPLFLKSGAAVDLVFAIDKSALQQASTKEPLRLPEGSFIEMKRNARAALSGTVVEQSAYIERKENVGVLVREPAKP